MKIGAPVFVEMANDFGRVKRHGSDGEGRIEKRILEVLVYFPESSFISCWYPVSEVKRISEDEYETMKLLEF